MQPAGDPTTGLIEVRDAGRGELLAGEMPMQVFRTYWPMASAHSFAATPQAVLAAA